MANSCFLLIRPEFELEWAVRGVNLLMRTRSTNTWPNWLQGDMETHYMLTKEFVTHENSDTLNYTIIYLHFYPSK